jgi:hypothetical protein
MSAKVFELSRDFVSVFENMNLRELQAWYAREPRHKYFTPYYIPELLELVDDARLKVEERLGELVKAKPLDLGLLRTLRAERDELLHAVGVLAVVSQALDAVKPEEVRRQEYIKCPLSQDTHATLIYYSWDFMQKWFALSVDEMVETFRRHHSAAELVALAETIAKLRQRCLVLIDKPDSTAVRQFSDFVAELDEADARLAASGSRRVAADKKRSAQHYYIHSLLHTIERLTDAIEAVRAATRMEHLRDRRARKHGNAAGGRLWF